jgi:surface antigen/uncharacterized protein YukE
MFRIRMDTDEVRMIASRLKASADAMEVHMATIKSTIQSANWQSNAREEYVSDLEMLYRVNAKSAQAMRLMAQAVENKAEQWEEIARIFAGPFHFLHGIWESFLDHLNNTWQGLVDSIGKIRFPKVLIIPAVPITVIAWITILDKINGLKWPPSWWPPFGSKTDGVISGGTIVGGEEPNTPPVEPPTVVVENKPYPQPPTNPTLNDVNGKPSSYTCATYARDRRPDLGSTQCDNEKFADQAAANYICKFDDKAYHIDSTDTDLTKAIGPGYALVWEPSHPYADDTYGHVAIVEQVFSDHLVYSEAVRINGVYTIRTHEITFDQLNNNKVWLIP